MSEEMNVCLKCGFCCDGTLLGFVQLDAEELAVYRNKMPIEEWGHHGFFFSPCENLTPAGCKIYTQRPKQCGLFECQLLKNIENHSYNLSDAVDVIEALKQRREEINHQMATYFPDLKSRSFYFKVNEVEQLLQGDDFVAPTMFDKAVWTKNIVEFNDIQKQTFGLELFDE